MEVLLRLAPLVRGEASQVHAATGNTLEVRGKDGSVAEYAFDAIFDDRVTQAQLFQARRSRPSSAPPLHPFAFACWLLLARRM